MQFLVRKRRQISDILEFNCEVEEKSVLLGIGYNMYETSFCIDMSGNQWIIIICKGHQNHCSLDTDLGYATSVEAVSADGVAIDPMLIERCRPSREVVGPDKLSQ